MYIIVIYDWKEETSQLSQTIARALGNTAYEIQQRLLAGSPTVLTSLADPQQALLKVKKLRKNKISTIVLDTKKVRNRVDNSMVRRFKLDRTSLYIEMYDKQQIEIPYKNIEILIPVTSIVDNSETKTVSERKFSLGKTIVAGGIPMSKKVTYRKEIRNINYGKFLYLCIRNKQQPVIFNQNRLVYDGLGSAMKISQEQNFTYLINAIHQLSPEAVYDDRLLKKTSQNRLLGPTLNPDTNLDIAVEILIRYLRVSAKNNRTEIP